jgi:hypothetical protein
MLRPLPFALRIVPVAQSLPMSEPEYMPADANTLARMHAHEAVGALVDVVRSLGAKGSERVAAAVALLDRGYGKPSQAIISVPARRRERALLSAMSTDDLLALVDRAKGEGGRARGEGPVGGGLETQGIPTNQLALPHETPAARDKPHSACNCSELEYELYIAAHGRCPHEV